MPTFAVDSSRTTMIATGKVTAVTEWTDGKRTDNPKRDPNTGMPLWLIDCLVDDDAARSTVAGVEVGSLTQPVVQKLRPITFVGLAVSVYVNRSSGALTARWSAENVAGGVTDSKAA